MRRRPGSGRRASSRFIPNTQHKPSTELTGPLRGEAAEGLRGMAETLVHGLLEGTLQVSMEPKSPSILRAIVLWEMNPRAEVQTNRRKRIVIGDGNQLRTHTLVSHKQGSLDTRNVLECYSLSEWVGQQNTPPQHLTWVSFFLSPFLKQGSPISGCP